MTNKNRADLFDGMKAPIDRDKLWGKLKADPDFPRKDDKRNRFIFFFVFLGFILGSALVRYGYSYEKNNISTSESHLIKEQTLVGSTNNKTKQSAKTTNTITTNKNETEAEYSTQVNTKQANTSKKTKSITQEQTSNSTKVLSASATRPSTAVEKQKTTSTTIEKTNLETSKEVETKSNTESVESLKVLDQYLNPTSPINLEQKLNVYETDPAVEFNEIFADIKEPKTASREDQIKPVKRLAQHLPFIFTKSSELKIEAAPQPMIVARTQPRRNTWAITLGTKVGADIWSIDPRRLTSDLSSDLAYNEIDQMVDSRGSFGFMLNTKKHFGKYFVGAGVDYVQMRQKLTQTELNVAYDLAITTDTDALYNRSSEFKTTTTNNQIQYVDAMLEFGRVFSIGSFELATSVGVGHNIHFSEKQQEDSSSNAGRFSFFSSGSDKVFYVGRLNLLKQVSERTSLGFGIEAKSQRSYRNLDSSTRFSFSPVNLTLGVTRAL